MTTPELPPLRLPRLLLPALARRGRSNHQRNAGPSLAPLLGGDDESVHQVRPVAVRDALLPVHQAGEDKGHAPHFMQRVPARSVAPVVEAQARGPCHAAPAA